MPDPVKLIQWLIIVAAVLIVLMSATILLQVWGIIV